MNLTDAESVSLQMVAGDFLCDEKVVQLVCSEGAEAVLDLVAMVRISPLMKVNVLAAVCVYVTTA